MSSAAVVEGWMPYFVVLVNLIAGIVMVVWSTPLSIRFCRLGKAIFRDAPPGLSFSKERIDSIYDERKAAGIFRLMGAIFIVQSVPLFVVAIFLSRHG